VQTEDEHSLSRAHIKAGSNSMQRVEAVVTLKRYKDELEGILSRFKETHDGIHIHGPDDGRFREIVLELRDLFDEEFSDGTRHSQPLIAYFNDGISNFLGSPSFHSVEGVKGVVVSALTRVARNGLALKTTGTGARTDGKKELDVVVLLAERLHLVIRQLGERRQGRPAFDVKDEYDVQDLFHALLTIHFDDIRKEEWTPSYGGSAARMDFRLPEVGAVVEMKKTRSNLSKKQLGEELIIDKARYCKHPDCRTLICVVYDPDGRISNPRGLESDLSQVSDELTTRVMIVPK
jgi:hypothetical protein